jgi:hypothetical protein
MDEIRKKIEGVALRMEELPRQISEWQQACDQCDALLVTAAATAALHRATGDGKSKDCFDAEKDVTEAKQAKTRYKTLIDKARSELASLVLAKRGLVAQLQAQDREQERARKLRQAAALGQAKYDLIREEARVALARFLASSAVLMGTRPEALDAATLVNYRLSENLSNLNAMAASIFDKAGEHGGEAHA